MKVILKCPVCGKIVNETIEIESIEKAKEIENAASLNPLFGWCDDCDRKPIPEIIGELE